MIGEKLDDRYEILEELGATPFSLSYKARDLAEDRLVAVKLLREEYSFDQEMVQKFISRAAAVPEIANLKNIAEVYASGQQGGKVFMVRQYVEGVSLRQKLEQAGGRLPLESVKYLGAQICEALFAAHQKNVIHTGLNPNDIIITPDDQVKVTDFGLSHLALLPTLSESEFTQASLDSLRYAAPEQFHPEKVEDQRTDLYQAGVILYELLLGQLPVTGASFQEYREGHLNGSVPAQPEVFHKVLQKDPEARFQGARELGDALAQLTDLPPVLRVSPMKLDLADIAQGGKRVAVLVVSNGGGGEITGQVEIDAKYGPHITLDNQEFVLTAARSEEGAGLFLKKVEVRLEVDTSRLEAGPHETQLRIISNAGEISVPVIWRVRLEGEAVETEEFTFAPAALNFGRLRWRTQKTLNLELRNTFSQPLEGKVRVSHPENLKLVGLPQETDGSHHLVMAPKSRHKVRVVFAREALPLGVFQGSIEFQLPGELKTVPVSAQLLATPRITLPTIPAGIKKRVGVAILGLLLLLGGYYWLTSVFQVHQLINDVEGSLKMGDYQTALKIIEGLADSNPHLQEIRDKLGHHLTYNLNAWYIDQQGRHQEWTWDTVPQLASGGHYRFHLSTNEPSYLYVFQVDSVNNAYQLFPNPQFSSGSNPLPAGKTLSLPDKKPESTTAASGVMWFYLDDKPGLETIYLVAAPWPSQDLEQSFSRIQAATTPEEKRQATVQLLSRLKERQEARNAGLQGVFFRQLIVIHKPQAEANQAAPPATK